MNCSMLPCRAAKALVVCALLSSVVGCDKGGDGGSDSNWMQEFWVVNDGQGVADAAPYAKGASTKVLVFNTFDSDAPPYSWLSEEQYRINANWIPGDASEVQLVAFVIKHEQDKGVMYNGGGHFYHYTCNATLRESLTGRLVASRSFSGDNAPPPTTRGSGASDWDSIQPALYAWLGTYIE